MAKYLLKVEGGIRMRNGRVSRELRNLTAAKKEAKTFASEFMAMSTLGKVGVGSLVVHILDETGEPLALVEAWL